jgi:hypothetical protein
VYSTARKKDDVSQDRFYEVVAYDRFRFVTDHSDESVTTPAPGEEPWATYLGLPDSIITLLADVVNLCADQPTESSVSVKERADRIETALKEWKPTSLSSTTIIDSTALVSRTIAGQLWRLCALVLLYQVRALHPLGRADGSPFIE